MWSLDERRCREMQYLHFWKSVAGRCESVGTWCCVFGQVGRGREMWVCRDLMLCFWAGGAEHFVVAVFIGSSSLLKYWNLFAHWHSTTFPAVASLKVSQCIQGSLNLNWCRANYKLSSLSDSTCTQFVSQRGHALSELILLWFRLPQLLSIHFPIHCHPVTLHYIVWVDWQHH